MPPDFSSQLPVGLTGLNLSSVPTYPVNADSNGNLLVKDYSDGPVTPGTVASASALIGGQYNSTLPTLTNTQQSAIQLDSSGRLIISPLTSSSVVTLLYDTNYGTVGTNTLRTASQIGNTTGAASFGAGVTGAQTLRVASNLYDGSGNAISSTAGALNVSAVQGASPWTIQGDSASGAAKAGNPIQIGGVFNTTQPTVTTGQTVEAQSTNRGALIVATGVDNFNIDNISGIISLPTGAATASNQATAITSLQLIANSIGSATGGTAASNSSLAGGVYTSDTGLSTPMTSGQQSSLQFDANGRLLISSVDLPTKASKFSFGELVTTTSTAFLAVESTTYTETTTNSAMTLVSASANDTSAGTGARTVTVTYLDQTGDGPFTTTYTMNGTTVVTAGVSDMCFIEKIIVTTVGSTGSNVGILTLKTGGGTIVGTIAATINQTLWAHHYIPTGKTCYISGFCLGNNATAPGSGAQFILKASTPTIANTPEIQVSDFLTVAGASNSFTRDYLSPIQVSGPARVRTYVLPFANANTTQFASFDFIDN